ncbi:enoyl-CoA hydratase-related protein [Rhizobium sp. RU36D]|uniref:enoyl-CoA hydratase/isomerase family protein n=1 Tax=Rhizobium sp. RU36D TaxID=1907415 RepID=UPI0009D7F21B|nr:enoyl-CoA hydratase-related protein [Rhizobium sp. RU36D]SMD19470.1 Enoyl-CoA hydratase/carnithine racemase [Rhizobium sp. RU36D]
MTSDDIAFDVCGPVATIRICREGKSNALARRHFDQLAERMRQADADESIRAIVLTGEGDRAFCAGADLSADERFLTGLADDRTTGLGDYLRRACKISKPIIGRVNGHCIAGGVGLLASCDIAIACDDVRIALPEIKLGVFPFVVLASLAERVPRIHAMQLALTGEAILAQRALDLGLFSQVVPRGRLDAAVQSVAAQLAAQSRTAVAFGLSRERYSDIDKYTARITEAESRGRQLALLRD